MTPIRLPCLAEERVQGDNALIKALHGKKWAEKIAIRVVGPDAETKRFPFLFTLSFGGREFHVGAHALPFAQELAQLSAPLDPMQLPSGALEAALAELAAQYHGGDDFTNESTGLSLISLKTNKAPPSGLLRHRLELAAPGQPGQQVCLLAPPDFPFWTLGEVLTPADEVGEALWPARLAVAMPLSAGRLRLAPAMWRDLAVGDILFPDLPAASPQIVTRPKG